MEKSFVKVDAVVYINGEKKTIIESYQFSSLKDDKSTRHSAISFAEGYAQAMMWMLSLNHPMSKATDGWHWWDKDGNEVIKAVTEDGTIITSENL